MNLGKTSAIFGTGVGIFDILRNRGRRHPQPDYAPHGVQGTRDGARSKFSINNFTAQINGKHNGLWQSNRYVVRIFPTLPIGKTGREKTGFWWKSIPSDLTIVHEWPNKERVMKGSVEDLYFLCNSASLPGVQVITSDHRRQGYGTFDRRPFGVMVTDIPLTFMVDNNGLVLELFNNWTQNIINYSYRNGEHGTYHGANLFEVAYRENYLARIEISCFDQTQTKIHTYKLNEAFPIQVGDITTAWAENDQFAVLPVQFTFRTFDIEEQAIPVENVIPGDVQHNPGNRI